MSRFNALFLILAAVFVTSGACGRSSPPPPGSFTTGSIEAALAADLPTSAILARLEDATSGSQLRIPAESIEPLKEYIEARRQMVEYQIEARGVRDGRDGVTSRRVVQAMHLVPRHEFVTDGNLRYAYYDHPLPIGAGQTISQPYIVALMTELIQPEPNDKVLEIGTGSGYQAAILGLLVKEVYTIEIVESLARRAEKTLARLGYDNVHVRAGDGYRGWPEHAPFDKIIVTAAPESVPEPLIEQLAVGGLMVIPVGPTAGVQELKVLKKTETGLREDSIIPVRFVPMTGEIQQEARP